MKQPVDRRAFLKTLGITGVAFAAASVLKGTTAAALEVCEKADPKTNQMAAMMTKTLKYVPASKTKGQKCENCLQFKPDATKKAGTCAVIAGCEVKAAGWCSSWSKKA